MLITSGCAKPKIEEINSNQKLSPTWRKQLGGVGSQWKGLEGARYRGHMGKNMSPE
jgi:hypothetical protein